MQFRQRDGRSADASLAQIVKGSDIMLWALAFAGGLFFGMLVMQHVGHGIAMRRIALDPDHAKKGAGVIEGAVFGLLSLLIAFTFSGAVTRFDARRHLISEEAIRIGTAWERIHLLPADAQPPLRDLFKQYLDSRLATYRNPEDGDATKAAWGHSLELQEKIWAQGVAASEASPTTVASMLFLPSVNQMIDITRTRLMATRMHPPPIVYAMLAVVALVGALLAGYHMAGGKARSWLHTIGFALVLASTVYVILDIEYPRLGLIRVGAADEVLLELRQSMN
jgi:hypothetical protein